MTGTGPRARLLLLAIVLAAVMEAVAGTALSVGRPDAMGAVHATPDEIAWLDTAYLVAKLTAFLGTAWLLSRVAASTCLAAAVVGLTATSLLAATSENLALLIAARACQGLAGGLVLAVGQTVLFWRFPKARQPLVQALFALGAVMAPTTLAPALEGWIIDRLSWSWIFSINLPLGAVALAALVPSVGAGTGAYGQLTGERVRGGADLLLLIPALVPTVYLLQQGSRWNWFDAPHIVACALLAGLAGGLFLLRQIRAQGRAPLLDLSVLRVNSFLFGFVVSFVAGFALSASAALIPGFARAVLHFPALDAGLLLLPSGAVIGLSLFLAGALVQFRGLPPFKLVPLGIFAFMIAMWLLSGSTSQTGAAEMMPALLLRGFGLGLLFIALTLITLLPLKGAKVAHGVGLFNFGRQFGGLIGGAVLQSYLDRLTAFDHGVLAAHLAVGAPAVVERQALLSGALAARGLEEAAAGRAALALIRRSLDTQLATLSYTEAFIALAGLFMVAAPLLVGLKIALSKRPEPAGAGGITSTTDA